MASSSAIQPPEKHDVFISFRGTDTRQTFTSHLYDALIRMKINAYIDDQLKTGEEIGPALLKAIEGSKIFVIIFSQDYASSTWCLDELVHIMDCKDRYKRIVIPIFYNIDPAIVRHQTESYAEAFAKHKSRVIFREEKLVEWKGALKTAANLSGFHSTSTTVRNDSDLVEQVIKDILTKLNQESSSDLTGLVGVKRRIQHILFLLCIVPDDIRIRSVGIWGMGGVGKTTLANAVFHELSSQFEACCFLPNVREISAANGGFPPQLYSLRDTLLGELLKEGSVPKQRTPTIERFVNERLQRTKVLVVLDDVDDWSQLEFLVGDQVSFGSGSRIIITTRDKRQLIEMEVLRKGADHDVKIYEVEELNGDEARQLFHVNAPRDICSAADSKEFLIKVLDYAAGNPLALKIWRSLFFRCKRKEDLEDLWNKLKKFPHKNLQNVCRISYEALEENEREIFLDMVCFHKGNEIVDVKRELDACGFFSNIGIEILIDMSLISIKDERLWIHDVIQEFGWDIVRKECSEEPGKRTRLYTLEDISHVLEKATGAATVKSISQTRGYRKIKLNPQAFTRMDNLIFLKINTLHHISLEMEYFRDLESFPDSLRYLHWVGYPFKSLPSQFSPKNVVELHMPNSQLLRLWNDGQNPENLKRINLRGSLNLVEIPDLSKSENIESINLELCKNLVQVPSTIWSLSKLVELNLGRCYAIKNFSRSSWKLESLTSLKLQGTSIVNLPTSICKMKFLKQLDLAHCFRFDYFPEILEPMEHLEELCLTSTAIKQLPKSIGNLVGLKFLELSWCRSLESVPQSIYKLNLLEKLLLDGCWKLKKWPSSSIILWSKIRHLDLSDYRNFEEIPNGLFNLTSLKRLNLSRSLIESIPPLVQFSELTSLDISNCKRLQSLPEVPCLLLTLDANGCTTLKTVSFSMTAITQGSDQIDISYQFREGNHMFLNCLDLDENARRNIMNEAQSRIMRKTTATVLSKRKDIIPELFKKNYFLELFERPFYSFSACVICPGNEIPKWFSHQTEGSSININLPPHSSDETFLGFAVCAVGTIDGHYRESSECRYNFKFNNGQCQGSKFSHVTYGNGKGWLEGEFALSPDHVFVWSLPFLFNDTVRCTEASFEFCATNVVDGKLVNAYIDDQLKTGEEIGPALLKAIEGSKIFVIIFSQDYASSTWCLDELVHIMDCKDRYKRIVIPIFYNIDPAIVRHQTESYAEAFAKHKSRVIFREEKLVEWKGALKTAANLSGFHSTSTTVRNDSDLVEQVIKDILTKLNQESSSDLTGLVGVKRRIQHILFLLCIVPDDIRIRSVGIWGMGGVGKTTLANAVFHELSSQFEACCFLPNVREISAANGGFPPQLYSLRDTLLGELLKEGSVPKQRTPTIERFVNERLQRTKVLVVLDDVDDWSQLEFLVGDQVSFGSGSRIIITTRDKRQLIEMEVLRKGADHDVKIYEVEELNGDEARQLFHVNAPRDICSAADSKEFLIKVLDYAAGNPLALKIWRSLFFRCKRKEDLEDLWNKLKKFPHKNLQNVCRISYEALEENEREIFLDMVCFHKGNEIVDVKRELDACGFFSNIGIEILIDMSLISIKDERLWIHDVIQEFGWDIVRKECSEEPGKRTRLYTLEDISHVLEKATGAATVKSISQTRGYRKIKLNPQAFTRMDNLIFLKINTLHHISLEMEYFRDLESFPDSLRYLHWVGYPFKSLPSQFSPKNVVELHMPNSQLLRLWNDGQNPENLKRINLRGSLNLVEIPDLSKSENIESINLELCKNLVQVPSTIWSLSKLVELNLGRCYAIKNFSRSSWKLESLTSLKLQGTSIVNLPTSICKMKFLKQLDLAHCFRFDYFPEILEPMEHLEELCLTSTAIKQLPKSIGNLVGLKFLELSWCRSLESVPQSIYKLNLLEKLLLDGCWKLKKWPSSSIILWSKIRHLDLSDYRNFEEIPNGLFNLTSLKRLNLSRSLIESIPPLVQFSELTSLDISNCKRLQSLPEVPCLLLTLDANGCTTLKTVSFSMTAITQGSDQIDISYQFREGNHMFLNCLDLDENARRNIMNEAQSRIMRKTTATVLSKRKDIIPELFKKNYFLELFERPFYSFSACVICPGNEIPKWFSHQTEGSSININLPPHSSDETFLGFAVCAVGTIDGHYRESSECRYNFKFNNGQCQGSKFSHVTYGNGKGWLEGEFALSPDHVFVWSLPFLFNDTVRCTEASFEFCATNVVDGNRVEWNNVKRCGVCLLYAQGQDAVAEKTKRPRAECEASGSEIVSDPGASEIQRPKRKTHAPGYLKDFVRK